MSSINIAPDQLHPLQASIYQRWGKRLLDICITVFALIPCGLVMGLIYVLLWTRLGPPVLFKQSRLGLNGQAFNIVKFRTMTNECDNAGYLLSDQERITSLGRFLRKFSLDELPELLLVLRGDMSLVGPRPLVSLYRERYTREQMRRHEAKPGLTGLAQVCGRNGLSWEDKFKLDVAYVDSVSLWLDIKIMIITVWTALRSEGISEEGHISASEFMGTTSR